jgi:rhamnose transport system permease protein
MAVSSAAAPSPPADAAANAPLAERLFPNNEWVLLVVIAVECLVFGMSGHNFASAGNAFEITRLGVEIGLLALALTPIIVTGGIDLSVGSMMGLAAVVLGWLWRDVGLPMPAAIALTLLLGVAGGALNALLITRLKFPPLIVTLGTLSLFRGIAEG